VAVVPDAVRDKALDERAALPPVQAAIAFALLVGIASRTLLDSPALQKNALSAACRWSGSKPAWRKHEHKHVGRKD